MRPPKAAALDEIAESIDYGVTASAIMQPRGPKFLRITDIQNGVVNWDSVPWCECDDRELRKSQLSRGDIVFARTGATTGKSFLIRDCPANSVFASYLIRVRAKPAVDPCYLSHFFQTPEYWAQITKSARGAAQPGVNATSLKALQIPLLPLAEQRRIAEVLDRAEALRAKRRAALAQIDTLAQSIFLAMFGNMREEECAPLGELADLKRGPFGGSLKKEIFVESGYKVYEQGNAIRNDFRSGRYFITERKFRQMEEFSVKPDDLIVSCSGTMGRVAIVPKNAAEGIINQALLRVRPYARRATSVFLKHCLEESKTRSHLEGFSRGTGLQNFPPMSEVRSLLLPAPPVSVQQEFEGRIAKVEVLKTAYRASLSALDSLFASLQHRAFRGEL